MNEPFDAAAHPRAGDGTFTIKTRTETDLGPGGVDLLDNAAPADLQRPIADALADRSMLTLTEEDFGAQHGFTVLDIADDGAGGHLIFPGTEEHMVDGLAFYLCRAKNLDAADHEVFDRAQAAATAWLVDNGDLVDEHLASQYGATNDDTRDWDDHQRVYCQADLGSANVTLADALAEADTTWARTMTEDFSTGTFYRDLLTEAGTRNPAHMVGHIGSARTSKMLDDQVDNVWAYAE
ncbi:hypothetical protein [Nocardioides sp. Leaf285]|uniref:hypothetical protein n=1 Tax=Nocardioides sp. Leaf285 TaxID=1736322 RepID=UPI00070258EC|nr:hypothetical protein [Nocardioides sp. Leaf285]KQP63138.1 hypothetical protein ASF47_19200 [Nocardioides sp. Leaf285]